MKFKILILIIITSSVFGLQYYLNQQKISTTQTSSNAAYNETFPNIELLPLNSSPFQLNDKEGVLYLINLWATWCGPCQYEIPHLNELYNEYHHEGIVIVGIALDDSDIPVKAFIKKQNIDYPIIMFNKKLPSYLKNIPGVPTTLTLDASLRIIDVVIGYQQKKYFEKMIKRAIN
tara:strand:- start:236 stop:760 length:525 start_codon:yes stop_codon:yes gene_type:complete